MTDRAIPDHRLNPVGRAFHGYAGDAPIYVGAKGAVIVDQYADDLDRVIFEACTVVGDPICASIAVTDATAMADAILARLRRSGPPLPLRELLALPTPPRLAWADAQDFAEARFGKLVSGRIRWTEEPNGEVTGVLAGGNDTLYLRYEMNEPGSERIYVRVPCPADGACLEAWDVANDASELLSVLEGQLAEGDPICEAGHDMEVDDPDPDPDGDDQNSWPADKGGWPAGF